MPAVLTRPALSKPCPGAWTPSPSSDIPLDVPFDVDGHTVILSWNGDYVDGISYPISLLNGVQQQHFIGGRQYVTMDKLTMDNLPAAIAKRVRCNPGHR